jgi:hypothetical protein
MATRARACGFYHSLTLKTASFVVWRVSRTFSRASSARRSTSLSSNAFASCMQEKPKVKTGPHANCLTQIGKVERKPAKEARNSQGNPQAEPTWLLAPFQTPVEPKKMSEEAASSAAAAAAADANVEMFKIKKLIGSLQKARGCVAVSLGVWCFRRKCFLPLVWSLLCEVVLQVT